MKPLPQKFAWGDEYTEPKIWNEARKHYGILEKEKGKVVPELNDWCEEMNVNGWFPGNDFPWCGLFVAIVVSRARQEFIKGFLGAKNWLGYGKTIYRPKPGFTKGLFACFMDIVIFSRPGGGHVGFLFAENKNAYLVYGGNQSNAVGFAWIAKDRCVGIQRPEYNTYKPVKLRMLTQTGELSKNEA
jgi:uncharacterized protein (TIGR02594 family)